MKERSINDGNAIALVRFGKKIVRLDVVKIAGFIPQDMRKYYYINVKSNIGIGYFSV